MPGFTITSDAFEDGAAIPPEHSCDGANLSPALRWSDPPAGTQGFALVMDDPDAPTGVFGHWAAYNIAREREGIAGGAGSGEGEAEFAQARNDFGKTGYGGPRPPKGHGPHRYRFKLYALDKRELIELGDNPTVAEVEQAAQNHAIDRAELTGIFETR